LRTCAFYHECDTNDYSDFRISILDIHGRFIVVGLPAEPLSGFNAMFLLGNGSFLGGSHIDSKKECLQILQLAADKGAKPWITQLPMSDAKKAVEAVNMNDLKCWRRI
jgi:alcohol dehydrogenase (NADP+)